MQAAACRPQAASRRKDGDTHVCDARARNDPAGAREPESPRARRWIEGERERTHNGTSRCLQLLYYANYVIYTDALSESVSLRREAERSVQKTPFCAA
jgi:hypothetical protein